MSIPTAVPDAPTCRAISIVVGPEPHPMSRTRIPSRSDRHCKALSPNGAETVSEYSSEASQSGASSSQKAACWALALVMASPYDRLSMDDRTATWAVVLGAIPHKCRRRAYSCVGGGARVTTADRIVRPGPDRRPFEIDHLVIMDLDRELCGCHGFVSTPPPDTDNVRTHLSPLTTERTSDPWSMTRRPMPCSHGHHSDEARQAPEPHGCGVRRSVRSLRPVVRTRPRACRLSASRRGRRAPRRSRPTIATVDRAPRPPPCGRASGALAGP
jgi:hypothetical protein